MLHLAVLEHSELISKFAASENSTKFLFQVLYLEY